MKTENQYYVILTNTIPFTTYMLHGGHTLRPVKTSKRMFEVYGSPLDRPAVMTLNHLGAPSDAIWKNLVMFHSFLCDDPETYDYSERYWKKVYEESELNFVRNQSYFYETTNLGNETNRRMSKRERINAIDFDHFSIKVYPTTKETLDRESILPTNERLTLNEALISTKDVTPEYEAQIKYKEAFQLFCSLTKLDKKLYNQMCLYVFAGNLKKINEVYRNDNAPVAFYLSILESQAGAPPTCFELLHCNICGRDIKNHGTSIEEHFMKKYGDSFKNLRKIRHKFFHEGEYSSILEQLWNIYDQRQDTSITITHPELTQDLDQNEKSLDDFENEVERLKKITRRTLIESFMHHYSGLIPHP
ncbi:MAG: hypothetical protein ACYDG5_01145 [Dehalococcoidales bacterium]